MWIHSPLPHWFVLEKKAKKICILQTLQSHRQPDYYYSSLCEFFFLSSPPIPANYFDPYSVCVNMLFGDTSLPLLDYLCMQWCPLISKVRRWFFLPGLIYFLWHVRVGWRFFRGPRPGDPSTSNRGVISPPPFSSVRLESVENLFIASGPRNCLGLEMSEYILRRLTSPLSVVFNYMYLCTSLCEKKVLRVDRPCRMWPRKKIWKTRGFFEVPAFFMPCRLCSLVVCGNFTAMLCFGVIALSRACAGLRAGYTCSQWQWLFSCCCCARALARTLILQRPTISVFFFLAILKKFSCINQISKGKSIFPLMCVNDSLCADFCVQARKLMHDEVFPCFFVFFHAEESCVLS